MMNQKTAINGGKTFINTSLYDRGADCGVMLIVPPPPQCRQSLLENIGFSLSHSSDYKTLPLSQNYICFFSKIRRVTIVPKVHGSRSVFAYKTLSVRMGNSS